MTSGLPKFYLPCSSQALSSVVVEATEGSLESLGAGTGRVAVDVVAAGGGGGATSLSGEAKLTAVRDSSGVRPAFLVRIKDVWCSIYDLDSIL